jgi:crossover junction endodeoxyribonuclease RuvC
LRHRGKISPTQVGCVSATGGELRILGIDPGSVTGYGIIALESSNPSLIYVASGGIDLSQKNPSYLRLKKLHDALIDIIKKYSPHEVAVEKVFFAKSAKAALSLGQARGVSLLAAASKGLNVYEYSALEVKKAVTGYGRAEKKQVQEMVKRILFPHSTYAAGFVLTEDAADALALAICHMNTIKLREAIRGQ